MMTTMMMQLIQQLLTVPYVSLMPTNITNNAELKEQHSTNWKLVKK